MERLLTERSISLGLALDRSTSRAYASALNSYLEFCSLHSLDPEPTPDTLSFYITFMSHHIQPRSVRAYLSGIVSHLEAFYPNVKQNRETRLVTRTLQGCFRRFSSPVRQKEPLTRAHLLSISASLPRPFTFDDLLFLSQLSLGFFALLRLGELVIPDNSHLRDPFKVPLRHNASVAPLGDSFRFLLPRDKSDSRFEGNAVFVQRSTIPPDPVDLFSRYLSARDLLFPLSPHLWVRRDGSPPTRSWFITRLHTFLPSSFSGHSMRAGGATSLAAAGVAPSQIQAIGRWHSDTWERYIRRHPTLLQALLFHGRPIHEPPFASVA